MSRMWDDRLAEVWAAPGLAGTGVVVGRTGVLTAAHVIAGVPAGGRILARVVRRGEPTAHWVRMRAVFASISWDMALLTVDETAPGSGHWVPPATAEPVVVRLGTAAEHDCEAAGFPRSAIQGRGSPPALVVRQPEQAAGVVLPAGHGKPPWDQAEPPGLMPFDLGTAAPHTQQEWAGMSGAAVLLPDGRLIGLVHAASAGHPRRLYLVPLAEALSGDPQLRAAADSADAPLLVEARQAHRYRQVLDQRTLAPDGMPFRVGEITDLEAFGVKRAGIPGEPDCLEYITRDGDAELDRRLAQAIGRQRMVLVVGDAAAGKSRSAAESARRVLPGCRLLCPRAGWLPAVAELPLDDIGPAMVWLDDADVHAHGEGLRDALARLHAVGLPVIATIRRAALEQLTSSGEVRNRAGEVLRDPDLADQVGWEMRWSAGECARLAVQTTDPGLLAAVSSGMPPGVYAVAGPQLLQQVSAARASDDMPWRYALILSVLDWYRTGIGTPAPLAAVRELLPGIASQESYPDALRTGGRPQPEDIDEALSWFSHNVTGGRGPLSQQRVITVLGSDGPDASLAVHDYVLDRDQQQGRRVPDVVWSAALQTAASDISAVFRICVVAFSQDRPDISVQAMTPLATDGNALAMCNLGGILLDRDPDSARRWTERALRTGEETIVPLAQANLGTLLMHSGYMQGARPLLEAAIGSGDFEVVPLARANLGVLLMMLGDLDGARPLLETAVATANPHERPFAQANLGSLLMVLGDLDGARPLLEAAAATGSLRARALGQAALGALLTNLGDMHAARALLETSALSGGVQTAALAQVALGTLLTITGELDQAIPLLETAAMSPSPMVLPRAQAGLGVALAASGSPERAKPLLEAAARSPNRMATPLAQAALGIVLAAEGDERRARLLLEAAAASADPLSAPVAQAGLGGLLILSGDLDGARPLLEAASRSANPLSAPLAQALLGIVLMTSGNLPQARPLLETAAASANQLAALVAQAGTGGLLGLSGGLAEARPLLEATARSAHPLAAALAHVYLGALTIAAGDIAAGNMMLKRADSSGYLQITSSLARGYCAMLGLPG
jgi:tetratricopeptide (TPR) repeat protein